MSDDHRHLEPPDDALEPLVTYSRVGPRPGRSVKRAAAKAARVEPHIDAREVPWTSDPDPFVAPDLRADPFDLPRDRAAGLGVDPLAPPRRPRVLRTLVAVGAVALVVGLGVLAVSFGMAGLGSRTAPVAAGGSAPTPLPAGGDEATALPEGAVPAVREISLTGDAAAAAGGGPAAPATSDAMAAPVEPPVPRPRPDHVAVGAPALDSSAPAAVAPATADAAVPTDAPAAAGGGEADFIARIEPTLATLPAEPSFAPAAPAVSAPAPVAVIEPSPTVAAEPPASAEWRPGATADGTPLDWSPTLDTVPPVDALPVMTGAAALAPAPAANVPVPPADIPNVSPSGVGFQ